MKIVLLILLLGLFTSFNFDNTIVNKKWKLENGHSIITFHNNNTYTIDIIKENGNLETLLGHSIKINWLVKDNYVNLYFNHENNVVIIKYKIMFVSDDKLILIDEHEIETIFVKI